MEYLRTIDFAALAASSERVSCSLLDHNSGASSCSVACIHTPSGDGSPAGLHTHVFDQIFYVMSGTMNVEVAGKEYAAGPGTLVVFPAGVPHRNWNTGPEPTVHLAVNAPLPGRDAEFAQPVAGG